ncbi:MAG: hypothetical protein ACOC80_03175 [Petrotogales bacterium]
MNYKKARIEAVVLTILLLGAMFLVPASSVEQIVEKKSIDKTDASIDLDYSDKWTDPGPFLLDRKYIVDPESPVNRADTDDAGTRRDAGDKISRATEIFPGEPIDNTPGRGTTGKLEEDDDEEDWYVFTVCNGQDITITMTPPSGHNYDLGLWDKDENERAISNNGGSTQETIVFTVDYTGEWFMKIHYISGSGDGQYSFSVSTDTQNDAGTGDDAGDDFADATLLSTEGTYYGYLDMDDEEDWYKFNANDGQGIHFNLKVEDVSYQSDFDIYLYNPSGNLAHYETYYYDDELEYPADETGFWRVRIKIFPGYTDIPNPEDWDYHTYGSGPYELDFALESSAQDPPDAIPQPEITPIAQTFKVANDVDTHKDEYGYLASIPACNYLEDGDRYISPILYTGDDTITNWFGTVDDTTDYLLDDWNDYLANQGKSAEEYIVPSDPVEAAAEIATQNWGSSNLAVVAIDGSVYDDSPQEVLKKTKTLKRDVDVKTVPSDSPDIIQIAGDYVYILKGLFGGPFTWWKWGAINVTVEGSDTEPSLVQVFPKFMSLVSDWWPEHSINSKYDIYYPITTPGVWAAGVGSVSGDWNFKITKYPCHRYRVKVRNPDSALKATVTTSQPSDLLVFLVDPQGHVRAPDIPDWNGGPINPIHEWNGIDDNGYPPDCNPWRNWNPEPHTEFTAEVLHPEKGTWQVIVVPRYAEGSANIEYTVTGEIREINQKRANADVSAANAAVIASLEHVPLLYVNEDSVPTETQDAMDSLGVNKVIFVEKDKIGDNVRDQLNLEEDLQTMQEIIDYIKDNSASENYITITSLKSGDGYFAPSAMLAAYHGSPVLRIGDAPGNPAGMANRIDTWRLWGGDYYHGNRAPGHLPIHNETVPQIGNLQMLIQLLQYLLSGEGELPPLGLDAKRYWNEEMHDAIHNWIDGHGLDIDGKEAYAFVAPRKDIRLEAHSVMMGNNSYAGHIPGDTPAYINDIIIRNVMYPALIFANPNRDVTTTQFMNFPDGGIWRDNTGTSHNVYSSRILKKVFMSHGRTYDGHCLWDAHLERLNDGASVMYYSGHGTGGSGISAQYYQTDYCKYPDQTWPDAWRGYMYDQWKWPRENGRRWYNPEPPNLYDIIHFKWVDQLLENLRSNAIFYMSCSTAQQFGPMVYLDHGAVVWYGNAGSGLCPEADLLDDWFFEDSMLHGQPIGPAYSQYIWLHYRDFTTKDDISMYGPSSLYGTEGITTVHCIYGDPNLILYSPEWTAPTPVDA